ncbi:TetR/AcrR family transcriptional regulator C-terminal domain-containing protein [Saccharomonospora sp. NPDC046836]|uniref:TetR/AcrR family transcriptional regulator C-terminal domain-containing protein n=1 Tax=Saccharomonospora sp. NPDC046836 TaxID=3156921 RepID=UPI0033E83292
MLFSFVRGLGVNLESAAQAEAETGMDSDERVKANLEVLTSLAAPSRFPMFERVTALDDLDLDLDALFELGLTCLLDGLASRLEDGACGVACGRRPRSMSTVVTTHASTALTTQRRRCHGWTRR